MAKAIPGQLSIFGAGGWMFMAGREREGWGVACAMDGGECTFAPCTIAQGVRCCLQCQNSGGCFKRAEGCPDARAKTEYKDAVQHAIGIGGQRPDEDEREG